MAVQIWPYSYEFYTRRLGLAGKFFFFSFSLGLSSNAFQRISHERCKLGVIAEATSHCFPPLPPEDLSPFSDHFHPVTRFIRPGRPENRRRGVPFLAVSV